MFEKLLKKKVGLPEIPKKTESEGEEVTPPEVDETLADVDAALAKAEQLSQAAKKAEREEREAQERREREERERYAGSRCGCGW